jgi:hypothetical protein
MSEFELLKYLLSQVEECIDNIESIPTFWKDGGIYNYLALKALPCEEMRKSIPPDLDSFWNLLNNGLPKL